MGSRKRTRSEATAVPEQQHPEEPGMLQRLRNCWELANLMQYIGIFGKLMKIDEEFEIEVCSARVPSILEPTRSGAFGALHRIGSH